MVPGSLGSTVIDDTRLCLPTSLRRDRRSKLTSRGAITKLGPYGNQFPDGMSTSRNCSHGPAPYWQLTVPPPWLVKLVTPDPSMRRYTFGKAADAMATVPFGCCCIWNCSHGPAPYWQLTVPPPWLVKLVTPDPSMRRYTFEKAADPIQT